MEKKRFDQLAEAHKELTKLCIERLGDDPLQAHRRATWMMQKEGWGYASGEDLEKAARQAKVPKAENIFKKALGQRGVNHFV